MENTLLVTDCLVCGEKNPNQFRIYFDGYIKVYRCRTCGHGTQFPGPGGNTMVDSYNDYYALDFVAKGQKFMYPYRERVLTDIARRAKAVVGTGRRILDVGCGDGQFLYRCEQLGFETVGVEPSHALAGYATDIIKGKVINGYYSKELFPEASFDVISFVQVVEHLFKPADLLQIARYHLKPGGIVVIEVPSRYAPHFLAYVWTGVRWFVKPPDGVIDCHVSYFTPSSMRRLVQKSGFSHIRIVTGRWKVKYAGLLRLIATITDPIMNWLGIGGILCIGKKN